MFTGFGISPSVLAPAFRTLCPVCKGNVKIALSQADTTHAAPHPFRQIRHKSPNPNAPTSRHPSIPIVDDKRIHMSIKRKDTSPFAPLDDTDQHAANPIAHNRRVPSEVTITTISESLYTTAAPKATTIMAPSSRHDCQTQRPA